MQKDWTNGLESWQSRVFAAGCAQRVTPLVEAFGTDTERWAWREALAAVWDGTAFDSRVLYRSWRARMGAPSVLNNAQELMSNALVTLNPNPAIAAAGAADTGWDGDDLVAALAEQYGATTLVDAERAAQARTLELVRRLPLDEAAAAVRTVSLDLGPILAGIDLPRSGPLGPRPKPRIRHASHAPGDAVPVAPQQPTLLVAADAPAFEPGPDGRAPFRSGDILRLDCAPAGTVVVQEDEDRLSVEHPWQPGMLWYLPRRTNTTRSGDNWTPVRIEPDPETLGVGDACQVGIAADVYLVEAYTFTPRRATRPVGWMAAWPVGVRPLGGYGRYDEPLDPYELPVEVVLVHRAYAYLMPGERVVDADGAELDFHPPLLFLRPDADVLDSTRWPVAQVPRWPLRRPDGSVVGETVSGCHDDEVDAWESAAGVGLPAEYELVPWFLRIGERRPTYRSM
ncbi:hypothetical protein AB0K00_42480 [Dactylosporangium sp. NPDC049525]|uniref:hypothetical protein n=1 Tax=Dactylosporangium sp. NPDC049525 TaxID=3154730 RepID=UPI00341CD779